MTNELNHFEKRRMYLLNITSSNLGFNVYMCATKQPLSSIFVRKLSVIYDFWDRSKPNKTKSVGSRLWIYFVLPVGHIQDKIS